MGKKEGGYLSVGSERSSCKQSGTFSRSKIVFGSNSVRSRIAFVRALEVTQAFQTGVSQEELVLPLSANVLQSEVSADSIEAREIPGGNQQKAQTAEKLRPYERQTPTPESVRS